MHCKIGDTCSVLCCEARQSNLPGEQEIVWYNTWLYSNMYMYV